MSHTPTAEQQAIIDAFRSADRPTLVVQAGAGCGKSSTLKMAARTQPHRRGLYVAYSRALAKEARADFPASVDCRTAHSLAFGPVGRQYKDRLDGPRVPAKQAAAILGFNSPVQITATADLMPLTPATLARLTMDSVNRFLNSADSQPGTQHVGPVDGYTRADNQALAEYLAPYVCKAWDDLQRKQGGRLKFTHDVYLKIYQLSQPRIPVDYVLLDEAQDLSPVMSSLFHYQDHAQRIMVGDSAQAIYGFRGAIDAMRKFEADHQLTLSQSFRFGPAIAAEANKWLDLLRAPLTLRGFASTPSTIATLETPNTVLCRSNAGAVSQVMQAVTSGRRAALVGGGEEIRRLAEAAEDLLDGRSTSHPELVAFKNWDQVREHAAQDEASGNLKVLVKLIDDHTPAQILTMADALVDEATADVIVSTAHKGKGREWDTVRIAGDFREPRIDPLTRQPRLVPDELMLAYVAVTRARLILDRTGLAWVDEWIPGSQYKRDPVERMAAVAAVAPEYVQLAQPAKPQSLLGPRRCTPDTCQGLCDEIFPDRCLWPAPLPVGA